MFQITDKVKVQKPNSYTAIVSKYNAGGVKVLIRIKGSVIFKNVCVVLLVANYGSSVRI